MSENTSSGLKTTKLFTSEEVKKSSVSALREAIRIAGSAAELARMIGASRQLIWRFENISTWGVSAHFVLAIEASTGGLVHRSQIRPDLYRKSGQKLAA